MRQLKLYTQALPADFSIEQAAAKIADRPFTIFLDSSDAQTAGGRYSFLATDPLKILDDSYDWQAIKTLLQPIPVDTHEDWPFRGGWMGYLPYEAYQYTTPKVPLRETIYPLMGLAFYDTFIVTNHEEKQSFLASLGLVDWDSHSNERKAQEKIDALHELIQPTQTMRDDYRVGSRSHDTIHLSSLTTREQYYRDINRIQELIAAGDCYQVNYSQRFEGKTELSPYALYQNLRRVSPAPYAAFLKHGDFCVLSSSPESFLEIRGNRVRTRPIKGTRPRGTDEEEDQQLCEELRQSEKDRAELLMITDLERNDLGRVCVAGSVETQEQAGLLKLPQVHHLYSSVEGKLLPKKSAWDVLNACFPGGSITGAPKIRAMQIIRELEPHPREVYTGAIGFISVDGSLRMNVAIRTMIYRQGHVKIYTGGGIVADSDPEAEYEECLVKMSGMQEALQA